MSDFVIRHWNLKHYDGNQAPPHVHDRGDEAFAVVRGRLKVLLGEEWIELGPGEHLTVPAGTTHTFATVDQAGADVFAVMTPEIDALVTALHSAPTPDVWSHHHSRLAQP